MRIALSLHDALYGQDYDHIIGTSERGSSLSEFELPAVQNRFVPLACNFRSVVLNMLGIFPLHFFIENVLTK